MSERTGFLARTPFFGGLPAGAIERVEAMLVERICPRGTVVFREGETGNSMYVVARGELVAEQAADSGGKVRLMRFGPGDFFGEMTLIEMQPRPFSVVADQDAVLWELTSAELYRLYREDIKAYVLVLQNLNRELCRRLRRAGNRITQFAGDASDERTQIPRDEKKR